MDSRVVLSRHFVYRPIPVYIYIVLSSILFFCDVVVSGNVAVFSVIHRTGCRVPPMSLMRIVFAVSKLHVSPKMLHFRCF